MPAASSSRCRSQRGCSRGCVEIGASSLVVAQAPTLAIAAPIEPATAAAAAAARAPIVEARVVGERVVPEGLLRVLSDGTRGAPRTLLTLARDVERPTVTPAARLPWFVRVY